MLEDIFQSKPSFPNQEDAYIKLSEEEILQVQ